MVESMQECFNPAEAEEWFRRQITDEELIFLACFNPAEAEEWFRSLFLTFVETLSYGSFNPAEAEEWFRRTQID